jgi:hypothetical protein
MSAGKEDWRDLENASADGLPSFIFHHSKYRDTTVIVFVFKSASPSSVFYHDPFTHLYFSLARPYKPLPPANPVS